MYIGIYYVSVYPMIVSIGIMLSSDGVQDMPPQNVLLWYTDYFQLKALEKQQMHREAFSELLLPT